MGNVPSEVRQGPSKTNGPTPVTIHVYDVGESRLVQKANNIFRALGTGAFHCAVEIYGVEWSYGGIDIGTGVFDRPPKGHEFHRYRESVDMGETSMSEFEVVQLVQTMSESEDWEGVKYDTLRHNCCHFSDALCVELGVGHLPAWVMNLAGAGATIADVAEDAKWAAMVTAAKANTLNDEYGGRARGCFVGIITFPLWMFGCHGERDGKSAEPADDRPTIRSVEQTREGTETNDQVPAGSEQLIEPDKPCKL